MTPERASAWSYQGIRLPPGPGLASAVALHAGLYLRRLLTVRSLWPYALVVLAAIAGGVGLARLALVDPSAIVEYFRKFVLRAEALIALGLATAALRADADTGVLGYHLLRPRAAAALPIGRFLAVALVVACLGAIMALGMLASTAGTVLMPPAPYIARMLLAVALAGLAYSAIFLLFAALVRPAAALGLGWLVAVDLVLASVSDTIARLSPAHHLGVLATLAPDTGLLGGLLQDDVLGAAAALLAITAVALGLAVLRLRGDVPR